MKKKFIRISPTTIINLDYYKTIMKGVDGNIPVIRYFDEKNASIIQPFETEKARDQFFDTHYCD